MRHCPDSQAALPESRVKGITDAAAGTDAAAAVEVAMTGDAAGGAGPPPGGVPRQHTRIHYSSAARPTLILDSGSQDVLDLSERGLRYRQDAGPEPQVGTKLEGILRLSRGETLPVRGTVVRVSHPDGPARPWVIEVAAHLVDVPIPRRVIIAERQVVQRGGPPPE
ncbi:MAG TPA: PilZ domain-containing protein [Gemmatimonadales bacterium]|nr:PilZ domain-containing protein [Gemmatimonadales bacterium]